MQAHVIAVQWHVSNRILPLGRFHPSLGRELAFICFSVSHPNPQDRPALKNRISAHADSFRALGTSLRGDLDDVTRSVVSKAVVTADDRIALQLAGGERKRSMRTSIIKCRDLTCRSSIKDNVFSEDGPTNQRVSNLSGEGCYVPASGNEWRVAIRHPLHCGLAGRYKSWCWLGHCRPPSAESRSNGCRVASTLAMGHI